MLGSRKKWPIHILDPTKCLHIHLLSASSVYKWILQFRFLGWISKQKYEYIQTGMPENGISHISMMKNWVSHILFLRKRGLIVYLAALKRGAFRAAHPYYVIYIGSYPPPPPTAPARDTHKNKFRNPTSWVTVGPVIGLLVLHGHVTLV